jgi:hypothetical protein
MKVSYALDQKASQVAILRKIGAKTKNHVQALRRSIKGEKNEPKISRISQKSAIAILPPKKVCSLEPKDRRQQRKVY